MNIIWTIIVFVGIVLMLIFAPNSAIDVMLSGCTKAVNLSISLVAIYTFWLGFLELLEKTGLNSKLSKILKPIIKFLFNKDISPKASEQICINLSSNFLGMGNAATPSGIKAIQELDMGYGKINDAMSMLIILNTSALQLIPTTVIGLRTVAGSVNSASIILPTFLTSLIVTIIGVILGKLFAKLKRRTK